MVSMQRGLEQMGLARTLAAVIVPAQSATRFRLSLLRMA